MEYGIILSSIETDVDTDTDKISPCHGCFTHSSLTHLHGTSLDASSCPRGEPLEKSKKCHQRVYISEGGNKGGGGEKKDSTPMKEVRRKDRQGITEREKERKEK